MLDHGFTSRRFALTPVVALLAAFLMLLAACGGGSDTTDVATGATETEQAPAATDVPEPAAAVEAEPTEAPAPDPTATAEPVDQPLEDQPAEGMAVAYIPVAEDDPAQLEIGAFVFAASCSGCHGETGEGSSKGRPLLDIALEQPDRLVHFASIQDGKGRMPGFEAQLSPEEIDAVTSYVRLEFAQAGIPVDEAAAAPAEEGDGEELVAIMETGATVWTASCAGCHGVNGEGTSKGRPLTGIGLAEPDINVHIASVTNGDGRMPAFAEQLTPEEIEAVVLYLRTTF